MSTTILECSLCPKQFCGNLRKYIRHVKLHQDTVTCAICNYSSDIQSEFQDHYRYCKPPPGTHVNQIFITKLFDDLDTFQKHTVDHSPSVVKDILHCTKINHPKSDSINLNVPTVTCRSSTIRKYHNNLLKSTKTVIKVAEKKLPLHKPPMRVIHRCKKKRSVPTMKSIKCDAPLGMESTKMNH